MTEIEELVRRSLAEQVQQQPVMTELAVRSIAGAAAVRRRRAALYAVAVVAAVVTTVAGVTALRDKGTVPNPPPVTRPPSTTASASPLPRIEVSALIDGVDLLLPDGRVLPVSQGAAGTAYAAYQIRDGWLVERGFVADPDNSSLWLYRSDGTSRRLVDRISAVLLAPDGKRLAWRSGNTLVVGHLDAADNVVQDATTTATLGSPQMFVGSAVILAYTMTGGGLDQWDVWVPSRPYTPSWSRVAANGVDFVLGATPDGRYAIGQVFTPPVSGGKDMCLARLDPLNALRIVSRTCGPPVSPGWASQSPDGHWLVYPWGSGTVVIDASAIFQRPRVTTTWPALIPGVWIGPNTYLAEGEDSATGANGHFYLFRVGQSTPEEVDIAGMPASRVVLVPNLS